MTYSVLLARFFYRLFDAVVCVASIFLLIVRDVTKLVRRWSEARLVEAAMQLDRLEEKGA